MKFYICSHCNQVYTKLIDTQKTMVCCENETIEIEPSNNHESHTLHLRKVGNFITLKVDGFDKNNIHHLDHMVLETNLGFYHKIITKESKGEAQFIITNDETILNAYAFCNIHWIISLN